MAATAATLDTNSFTTQQAIENEEVFIQRLEAVKARFLAVQKVLLSDRLFMEEAKINRQRVALGVAHLPTPGYHDKILAELAAALREYTHLAERVKEYISAEEASSIEGMVLGAVLQGEAKFNQTQYYTRVYQDKIDKRISELNAKRQAISHRFHHREKEYGTCYLIFAITTIFTGVGLALLLATAVAHGIDATIVSVRKASLKNKMARISSDDDRDRYAGKEKKEIQSIIDGSVSERLRQGFFGVTKARHVSDLKGLLPEEVKPVRPGL